MASRKSDSASVTTEDNRKNASTGSVRTKSARVRRVSAGDTARSITPKGVESFVVSEAVSAAQGAKVVAAQDIVRHADNGDMPALAGSLSAIFEGAAPDDAKALRAALIEGLDPTDSSDCPESICGGGYRGWRLYLLRPAR